MLRRLRMLSIPCGLTAVWPVVGEVWPGWAGPGGGEGDTDTPPAPPPPLMAVFMSAMV